MSQDSANSGSLGARIAELREGRGISQAALKRETGANIWRIENDYYSPQIATLEKIARALGIEVSEFFE